MEKDNVKVAGEAYLSQPINAVILAFNRWRNTNLGTSIKLILLAILVATGVVAVFVAIGASSANTAGLFNEGATFQQFADWAMHTGWIYLLGLVVAAILVCLPFNIGVDYSLVTSQNTHKVGVKESIRRGYKRFGVGLGAYLLSFLFVVAGLVLLIIPGIYVALRLSYINSVIANENLGPMDSIRRSWALTKGNLWDIIGALSVGNILVSLLNILITVVGNTGSGVGDGLVLLLSTTSFVLSIITAQVYYFRYHQSALEKTGELKREGTDKLNYVLFVVMVLFSVINSSTANGAKNTSPLQNTTVPSGNSNFYEN